MFLLGFYFLLGVCYIQGVGIIKNESVGFDLVKFAAEKGDITAIINLALLYVHGCGTSVNNNLGIYISLLFIWVLLLLLLLFIYYYFKYYYCFCWHFIAAEYLQKAAESGSGQAAYQLGQLYLHGRGTGKDESKAFQCFALAADEGLMEAQVGLAQCYANGIGTDADLQAAR